MWIFSIFNSNTIKLTVHTSYYSVKTNSVLIKPQPLNREKLKKFKSYVKTNNLSFFGNWALGNVVKTCLVILLFNFIFCLNSRRFNLFLFCWYPYKRGAMKWGQGTCSRFKPFNLTNIPALVFTWTRLTY